MRILLDSTPQDGGTPSSPIISPTPSLKPSMAKEMPAELKGTTFTKDAALKPDGELGRVTTEDKRGNVTELPQVVKTEEPKKVDKEITVVEKPEVKKVEPEVKKEEVKKEETKLPSYLKPPKTEKKDNLAPVLDPTKVVRDYTGYDESTVAHLKQMSNEAFAFTTDLIKKNKDLDARAKGTYLQSPDAYILSPEFKEAQGKSIQASKEAELYEHLLNECKLGNEIQLPEGYDENGNFIFSKGTIKPTAKLEEELRMACINMRNLSQQTKTQLMTLQNSFQTQVKTDIGNINNWRQQFDWNKNPSLMNYSLPIGDLGDRTLQQIKDDVKGMVPIYMQSHPLVDCFGDLVIALRIANAELMEAKSGRQIAEIKKDEAIRGEPTSDVKPSANGSKKVIGGVTTFSREGIPSN